MLRKKNNYFALLLDQVSYCVAASELLQQIVRCYGGENILSYREQMHRIEHTADGVHHDILNRLSTEFITPIDQEDILRLVQLIDDITDALDEVILDCYMYHIKQIPQNAIPLTEAVMHCVQALYEATEELQHFKRPELLRRKLVKINDMEVKADELFIEAVHDLFANVTQTGELLGCKAIYDGLENCCDLCEHAADVMEQIILKNT